MARRPLILVAIGMAAFSAFAAMAQQEASLPSSPVQTIASVTDAATFSASLVSAIVATTDKNAGVTPVEMQALLEDAIQAVFVQGNASPEVAKAGTDSAKVALTAKGLYCAAPAGPPTSTCEAVAKAVDLAMVAAVGDQTATGAINGGGSSPFGLPPSSGSGGGGGGVTHPPVS